MNISIVISTYGEDHWADLARERAYPSARFQNAHEIVIGHDPDATIAQVRNALAGKAEGDWLCFLDADDELAPGYVDAMKQAHERRNGDDLVLLTPAVSKIQKGRPRPPTFYPQVDLRQANWLIVGTLIHRILFMEVGGFDDEPHGFEDAALWSKAYRAGAEVVKVPQAVYIQHVNPNSKHRQAWRDREWQVATHQRVYRELDEWEAAR